MQNQEQILDQGNLGLVDVSESEMYLNREVKKLAHVNELWSVTAVRGVYGCIGSIFFHDVS